MIVPPVIRVGMPLASGEMLQRGLLTGLPLMFSANAFARYSADRAFAGFRLDAAAAIPEGSDCALDSAGFCAASIFGDYRFSVDDYLDLASARPWAFVSALDMCVEAQVAPEAATRRLRVDTTIARYFECLDRAAQRGLAVPVMAVLQGWFPEEYVRCAEAMLGAGHVGLVGIGSVCRRHLNGPDGVLAITAALDSVLPRGVRLHYFGLKGGAALAALAQHFPHRLGGTDSMAYDMGVRRAHPVGRTQALRIAAMEAWHARETRLLAEAHTARVPVIAAPARPSGECEELAAEAVGSAYGDLVRRNDLSYADAKHHMAQDAALVGALLRAHGPRAFEEDEPDDDFGLGVVYSSVRNALTARGYIAG